MSLIDDLNPYPSFRDGQRESIQGIVRAVLNDEKIIEYRGPTGCGKSLVLSIAARALRDEGYAKTTYTTPQKALVHQLAKDDALGVTALLGRANYHCPKVPSKSAADCPVPVNRRRRECPRCPYVAARGGFIYAPLGATTMDKILVDRSLPTPDILIVDESQGLERKLLDQRTIQLPEMVDLQHLEETVEDWIQTTEMEAMKYAERLERLYNKIRPAGVSDEYASLMGFVDSTEAIKTAKRLDTIQKVCERAKGVLRAVQGDPGAYMVDSKTREFKLISGKSLFQDMIMNIRAVILASGTPCTAMIADQYYKIDAPHPVDIERRRVYYCPIGKMNYQERTKTIDIMAEKIAALHKRYNRNTLVHCHSFAIAELLGHAVYDYDVRCGWVEKGKREENIARWADSDNVCLMSVACEEGLDLPGEKYPLNIIAKVPFVPYKSDEWTDRRKEADNKLPSEQRYENVSTAIAIQQAAGRCTRGPDDFSETWILDASFEWFYKRHYMLFEDWFKDALVRVEQ